MAFLDLTKEENPKLAIQTNTSLKYKKEDGSLGDKTPKTALITAVRSAGEVAAMDKGPVTFSINTDKGYSNFFVNRNDKGDIVLVPTDKDLRGDKNSYLNFIKTVDINNTDRHYFVMKDDAASKQILDTMKIINTEKSSYIDVRATLKNDAIKNQLISLSQAQGEKFNAIIGKDSLNYTSATDANAATVEMKKYIESHEAKANQHQDLN